jgi:hypothetical protein
MVTPTLQSAELYASLKKDPDRGVMSKRICALSPDAAAVAGTEAAMANSANTAAHASLNLPVR